MSALLDEMIKYSNDIVVVPCVWLKVWIRWGYHYDAGSRRYSGDNDGDAIRTTLRLHIVFHWVYLSDTSARLGALITLLSSDGFSCCLSD